MYKIKPLEWVDGYSSSAAIFLGIEFCVQASDKEGKWNVSMVVPKQRPENEHDLNSREQAKRWAEEKLLPMVLPRYLEEVDIQAERYKVLKVPYTQLVLNKPIPNMATKVGTTFEVFHSNTYSYIIIEGGIMILNQVVLDFFAPVDIHPVDVGRYCGAEEKALRELVK